MARAGAPSANLRARLTMALRARSKPSAAPPLPALPVSSKTMIGARCRRVRVRAMVGLTRPPRTAKSSEATVPNTRMSRFDRSSSAADLVEAGAGGDRFAGGLEQKAGAHGDRARVDDSDARRVDLASRRLRGLHGARHGAGDVHRDDALADTRADDGRSARSRPPPAATSAARRVPAVTRSMKPSSVMSTPSR